MIRADRASVERLQRAESIPRELPSPAAGCTHWVSGVAGDDSAVIQGHKRLQKLGRAQFITCVQAEPCGPARAARSVVGVQRGSPVVAKWLLTRPHVADEGGEAMSAAPDLFSVVFKTGNRVPVDGVYVDQHGVHTTHQAHRTFPPCIGRQGECAFRQLVRTL